MIIYYTSAILGRKIKTDTETKITTVDEFVLTLNGGNQRRIKYSLDEIKIIEETAGEITPLINNCKKIFDGQIVKGELRHENP